jgi:hypothetical protein
MATLDLRPLAQETIDQIGLEKHDLWLVKIHDELFGPFETESLKQYASENQTQFDEASASRMDTIDYKPFWENPLFQRRALKPVSENHDGPYWLLDNGMKSGPLSFNDIDKKIEMGLLVMTDHVSVDDGETWKKICELQQFDRRILSAEELPATPTEEVFHIGKLELVEKLENSHETTVDQLADLAHVGKHNQEAKVIPFKADEVALQMPQHHEMSSSLKWAVPAAAAVVVTLLSTGYLMFNGSEETPLISEAEHTEQFYQKKRTGSRPEPRGSMPSMDRMPASTGYSERPVPQENHIESRYPTHLETHERPFEENLPERDFEPVAEGDPRPQEQEHSLVAGNQNQIQGGAPEEHSLDAAMNGENQPQVEVPQDRPVEEASDF